jgi:hypothetical protein
VPVSITVNRCRGLVLNTFLARKRLPFLPPGCQFVENRDERIDPRQSVAVVLPQLPVTVTKMVRRIIRRHTAAAALRRR